MTYRFSEDWFTPHVSSFRAHLEHLSGSECKILEIGTFEGRSTTWLLTNIATHSNSRIDTIDLRVSPNLCHNLAVGDAKSKITFHQGFSRNIIKRFLDNSYDFIYIDGNHWTLEVLEDAVHCFRLLKSDGVMAFDDYLWDDPRFNQQGTPKEAIDIFIHVYARKILVLEREYQVWIRKICD